MNMSDYPHITIVEDRRLCSTGQHRPGFLRMLYDALLCLGYNRDVLVSHGHMSMGQGLEQCEVSMTIPLNPTEPWMATVNGVELDDTVEQMAQVALTSFCGSHLTNTATMSIVLFLTIREIPCGSSALRLCPTLRVLTSTPAWIRWLSMDNTRSTYNIRPPGLSSSSA
jgi:hypothetical protein